MVFFFFFKHDRPPKAYPALNASAINPHDGHGEISTYDHNHLQKRDDPLAFMVLIENSAQKIFTYKSETPQHLWL